MTSLSRPLLYLPAVVWGDGRLAADRSEPWELVSPSSSTASPPWYGRRVAAGALLTQGMYACHRCTTARGLPMATHSTRQNVFVCLCLHAFLPQHHLQHYDRLSIVLQVHCTSWGPARSLCERGLTCASSQNEFSTLFSSPSPRTLLSLPLAPPPLSRLSRPLFHSNTPQHA